MFAATVTVKIRLSVCVVRRTESPGTRGHADSIHCCINTPSPRKSHHNRPDQAVCKHNILHTANVDNKLPLPEFTLGLAMLVTEENLLRLPKELLIQISNDQLRLKRNLLLFVLLKPEHFVLFLYFC